jgi:hypothetical protein
MFEGEAKPIGQARRSHDPFAVEVRLSVQRVKQERVTQFFTSREDRRKARLEQVIVLLDRVGQVDRPHAGLPGDAVQLLQREHRVSDGQGNPGDKTVREGRVRLKSGVIDDLREPRTLLRSGPLPRRAARQGQDVHLDSMLVHPLASFIQIEVERKGIGRRRPSHFNLRFGVGLRSPVRVHVDRDRPRRSRRRTCLPGWSLLCRQRVRSHHRHHRGGAGAQREKVSARDARFVLKRPSLFLHDGRIIPARSGRSPVVPSICG